MGKPSPSPTGGKRVAIYTRYSSDMQSPRSTADQERECRQRVERDGDDVVLVEKDDAVRAGALAGRDGFERLMAAARRGGFEVLMVDEQSRFSRDFFDGLADGRVLRDSGILFADSRGTSLNLKDPIDQLRMAFGFSNAEQETKRLGERSKRGLKGKILSKFSSGGQPPYGFRREPLMSETEVDLDGRPKRLGVRFEPCPTQAPIVAEIFRLYAEGISKHRIASRLNERGVPSKRAGSFRLGRKNLGAWSPSGIKTILENEIYVGVRVWNRNCRVGKRLVSGKKGLVKNRDERSLVRVEGFVTPIVEKDVFERVRRRLKIDLEAFLRNHTAAVGGSYLLSGLIKCGSCGCNFVVGLRLKGVPHYRCSTRSGRGASVCANARFVPSSTLEMRVKEAIDIAVKDPRRLADLVREHNRRVEDSNTGQLGMIDTFRRRLADLRSQQANLVAAIKMGRSLSTLVEELGSVETQILSVEKQIEDAEAMLKPILIPRALAVADYLTGDASLFSGGRDKDRVLIETVIEAVVIHQGVVLLKFRDDSLFASVREHVIDSMTGDASPSSKAAVRKRNRRSFEGAHAWLEEHPDRGTILGHSGASEGSWIRRTAAEPAENLSARNQALNSMSDPSGIRTRVRGLKGHCPGPG
jgi:site-specific DNA recombinase